MPNTQLQGTLVASDLMVARQMKGTESRKKKHRRGKKRIKPCPYQMDMKKRSFNESGDQLRYSPQAPENYTQFIMSDHLSETSSDDCNDFDTQSFLSNEFEKDFKQVRAEDLALKTKEELSRLVLELENRESSLKTFARHCEHCNSADNDNSNSFHSVSSSNDNDDESDFDDSPIELVNQLRELKQQNKRLIEERRVQREEAAESGN